MCRAVRLMVGGFWPYGCESLFLRVFEIENLVKLGPFGCSS